MKVMNKKISMICQTETDGTLSPIRFQVKLDDGVTETYDVIRVLYRDLLKINSIRVWRITCDINFQNTIRRCVFDFHTEKCLWTIHKL